MTSPYVIAVGVTLLTLFYGHLTAYIHVSESSRAFGFNTNFRTAMFPISALFAIVSAGILLIFFFKDVPVHVNLSLCIPFVTWVITAIVYYCLKKHR